LLLPASPDLKWLCAQEGYAFVAHRASFQLLSQYLKNSKSGSFSISALKYVYTFSLAFPQEGGAKGGAEFKYVI